MSKTKALLEDFGMRFDRNASSRHRNGWITRGGGVVFVRLGGWEVAVLMVFWDYL